MSGYENNIEIMTNQIQEEQKIKREAARHAATNCAMHMAKNGFGYGLKAGLLAGFVVRTPQALLGIGALVGVGAAIYTRSTDPECRAANANGGWQAGIDFLTTSKGAEVNP